MHLVGPRTFRAILAKHGITDSILVRRLFVGFCGCGPKIDYRDFLRTFCSVLKETSVSEKLGLIVPLYDTEGDKHTHGKGDGLISLAELLMIVVRSVQGNVGDVGSSRLEQERRDMGLQGAPPIDTQCDHNGARTLEIGNPALAAAAAAALENPAL